MLKRGFTRKGLLSVQDAAVPPSQTEATLASVNFWPVLASQDKAGRLTLPLLGQEQLGLQQSQYPVVHVPRTHEPCPDGNGVGPIVGAGVCSTTGTGSGVGSGVNCGVGSGVRSGVGCGVGGGPGLVVDTVVASGDSPMPSMHHAPAQLPAQLDSDSA